MSEGVGGHPSKALWLDHVPGGIDRAHPVSKPVSGRNGLLVGILRSRASVLAAEHILIGSDHATLVRKSRQSPVLDRGGLLAGVMRLCATVMLAILGLATVGAASAQVVPANSTISVTAGSRYANNMDGHTVSVIARDSSNEPYAGAIIAFSSGLTGVTFSPTTCTTDSTGSCSVQAVSYAPSTGFSNVQLYARVSGQTDSATYRFVGEGTSNRYVTTYFTNATYMLQPLGQTEAGPRPVSLSCDKLYGAEDGVLGVIGEIVNPDSGTATYDPLYRPKTTWGQANSTIALGPQGGTGGTLTMYSWPWNSGDELRSVVNGETVQANRVPATSGTYVPLPGTSSYNYWSGGEVFQQTGEIFFTGGEDSTFTNNFRIQRYDPISGAYVNSGEILPASTSDTTTGYPASDMAIDANGNLYLIVGTSSTKWLVRVVPSSSGNWLYNRVVQITGVSGTDVWGMAFLNGTLYVSTSSTNLYAIDVFTGVATSRGSVSSVTSSLLDLASCQTAPVVQGVVYNDVNGDGAVSLAEGVVRGITVEIYDSTMTLKGERVTDEQGQYSFIVNNPNATYYIRLKQPRVGATTFDSTTGKETNGVNAAQTWANAGTVSTNTVTAYCTDGATDAIPTSSTGICHGARLGGADPASVGTSLLTQAQYFSRVVMTSDQNVATVSFGLTTARDYGDAPSTYGTLIANSGPAHIAGDAVLLRLGTGVTTEADGQPGADADLDQYDDGVQVVVDGVDVPLQNATLVTGRTYTFKAAVGSSPARTNGYLDAWIGLTSAGALSTTFTTQVAADLQDSDNDGTITFDYTIPADGITGIATTYLRFRWSSTPSLAATGNPLPDIDATSTTTPWVIDGEVEDYKVTLTTGQLRLSKVSRGGVGTFGFSLGNISTTAPSTDTDSLTTTVPDTQVDQAATTLHAINAVNTPITITENISAVDWEIASAVCTDAGASVSGNPTGVLNGVSISGNVITIPAENVRSGADIGCVVTNGKTPTLELLKSVTSRRNTTDQFTVQITALALASPTVVASATTADTATSATTGVYAATNGAAFQLDEIAAGTPPTNLAQYQSEIACANSMADSTTVLPGGDGRSFTVTPHYGDVISCTLTNTTIVPAASTSTLQTTTGDKVADGTETHTATVTVRDAASQLVVGETVSFTLAPTSGATLLASTCVTDDAGQCNVDITATVAGTYQVAATLLIDGTPTSVSNSPQPVVFVADEAVAADSTLSVLEAGPIIADGTTSYTVQATIHDANDNPVAGETVSFSVSGGTAAPLTCVSDATGGCSVAWTSTTAGSFTVSASITDGTLSGSPITRVFTAGTAVAANSTLVVTGAGPIIADGVASYTAQVTVHDANNNIVTTATEVSFSVSGGATSAPTCTTTDGVCSVTWTSTTAGSFTLDAALGSDAVADSPATRVFTADTASAMVSTLSVLEAGPIIADGVASYTVQATIHDANNNPVSGETVSFSVSGGSLAPLTCVSDATGLCSVAWTSTTAGSYTVSASITGGTLSGSPITRVFTAGTASATTSSLAVLEAGPITADGVASYTVQATIRDANNNPVSGETVSFSVGGGTAAPLTCVSDATGLCSVAWTSTTAGSFTVSASIADGTLSGSPITRVFTAGTASATTSALSVLEAGPITADGTTSYTVQATIRDANDNPVAGETVSFSVSGGSLAPLTCVSDASGLCSVAWTSTTAGSYTVSASITDGTLGNSPITRTFTAGTASATTSSLAVLETGPITADGTASYTVQATIRDANNNPVAGETVSFSVSGGSLAPLTCVSDATGGCSVAWTSTTAGSFTVSASITDGTLSNSPITRVFTAGTASATTSSLAVLEAGPITADGVANYTVQATIRDANDNPVAGETVSFTVSGGSLAPLTCVSDASGLCSVSWTSTTAGSYTVSASITGGTLGNSPITRVFTAGTASATTSTLNVLEAGPITADGVASYTVQATIRDANNNPVSGETVSFTVTGGSLAPLTCVSDASGLCSVAWTSTTAGSYTVSASITDGTLSGSPITRVFTAGTASATTSSLAVLEAGPITADGVASYTVQATIRDANNNPVAGETVSFTVSGGSLAPLTCVSDATGGCSVAWTSTTAGSYTVSASITDGTLSGSPITRVFTAGTASATTSSLAVLEAGPITADGVASYTVQATIRDANNNPVAGETVSFSVSGGSLAPLTCVSEATGLCSVSWTSTTAGSYTVSASITDGTLSNSPITRVFTAGTASATTSTLNVLEAGPITADGVASYTVQATIRDANDNPVAGETVSFSVGGGSLAPLTCVSDASGLCSVSWTSTTAGSYTVSASITGGTLGNSPITRVFTAGTASATTSALSVLEAGPITADGTTSYTVQATIRDANNNPVAGETVSFTVSGGTAAPLTCVSDASGGCSVAWTSSTAGSYTVSASIADGTLGNSPITRTFTAGAASATVSALSVLEAGPITADGVASYTVQATIRDANNNPVAGETVSFSVGGGTAAPLTCVSDASGLCSVAWTSSTAGSYTVSASIADGTLGNSPITRVFTAGTASATVSALSVLEAGPITADSTTSYTVQATIRDANNNPVAGETVSFSVTGGTVAPLTCVSDTTGLCSVSWTSTTAGSYTVSASITAGTLSGSPITRAFTAGTASATTSALSVLEAGPITADGVASYTVQATIRDANDNPVAGETVSFSVSGGSLASLTCVSDTTGLCSVSWTSTTAGSYTVSASITDGTLGNSPITRVFTAGTASATTSALSVLEAGPITADGTTSYTVQATIRDANNNSVAGETVSFTVSGGSLAPLTCVSEATGVCSVTWTSTTAGTYELNATLDGNPVNGSPAQRAFISDTAIAGNSQLTVSSGTRTADGIATHTATVTVRDASNNTVAGVVVDFTVATGATASAASCTSSADGTCQISITSIVAGIYAVNALIDGASISGSPADVTFVPGTTVTTNSAITVSTGIRAADGQDAHTVTVMVRDENGNPIPGINVLLSVNNGASITAAGNAGGVEVVCTTASDGSCQATVTSTRAGTVTVNALIDATHIGNSPGTLEFAAAHALSMTKSISDQPLQVGKSFNYVFTFRNQGLADVSRVNFADLIPVGIRILASPAGGSCTVNGAAASFPVVGNGNTVLVCFINVTVAANGGSASVLLPAMPDDASVGTRPVNHASWSEGGTTLPENPTPGQCQVNCTNDGGPNQPIAAAGNASLRLTKQAGARQARIGDLVRYSITIENQSDSAISDYMLQDTPPAGFSLVQNSLTISDGSVPVITGSNPIRISQLSIAVGGKVTMGYMMRIGAGVRPGTYSNQVGAYQAETGAATSALASAIAGYRLISNMATAQVTITGSDPLLDESLIFGTVFNDRNRNGFQDPGDEGIPGARIASAGGLIIETDRHGRYSLPGILGGSERRGRNFILKVDPTALPSGSTFTTDNPLVRRITPGIPVRFDFGVHLPQGPATAAAPPTIDTRASAPLELELGDAFFAPGQAALLPQYLPAFDKIVALLNEHGSGRVLMLSTGTRALDMARAQSVRQALDAKLAPAAAARVTVTVKAVLDDPGSILFELPGPPAEERPG